MANKDHSLDERIISSAMEEFMHSGFEKASMRKIAAGAEVTIGAIYTRYDSKDSLFRSLVQPLILRINSSFSQIKEQYYSGGDMAKSMAMESQAILHLLFDEYDRAVLLLCKSQGSSLESFFSLLVDRKIQETLEYFRLSGLPDVDKELMKLLISSQFHSYYQIIEGGCELNEAKKIMNALMVYHSGGWMALFSSPSGIINQEDQHEV